MLAIIGGSGLTQLSNMEIERREVARTPYGEPSGALAFGRMCNEPVVFLARHGYGHTIPPHLVNYRANISALKSVGVDKVVSVASVGGIRSDLGPGVLVQGARRGGPAASGSGRRPPPRPTAAPGPTACAACPR